MDEIQVKGIHLLDEAERIMADELIKEHYAKIQREFKGISSLIIQFKEYKKESKRKKYSVNVKAIAPGNMFESEVADWDLAKTIHKAMNKIKSEIEHKLHVSSN